MVFQIVLPSSIYGSILLLCWEFILQVRVSNYWEAIGVVAAHKAGINPDSLRRDRIKNIQKHSLLEYHSRAMLKL